MRNLKRLQYKQNAGFHMVLDTNCINIILPARGLYFTPEYILPVPSRDYTETFNCLNLCLFFSYSPSAFKSDKKHLVQ